MIGLSSDTCGKGNENSHIEKSYVVTRYTCDLIRFKINKKVKSKLSL